MTLLRSCTLALSALACALAAPKVEKVEPPNWWVPHTHNPVQILLTGSDLKGAAVTTSSKDFKIEVRTASDDGRYLFLYLDIGRRVRPGAYRFALKSVSGTGEFTFTLDRPLEARGRFQGFSPDDVIYLPTGTPASYHGGDLPGIREHLDYLKDQPREIQIYRAARATASGRVNRALE